MVLRAYRAPDGGPYRITRAQRAVAAGRLYAVLMHDSAVCSHAKGLVARSGVRREESGPAEPPGCGRGPRLRGRVARGDRRRRAAAQTPRDGHLELATWCQLEGSARARPRRQHAHRSAGAAGAVPVRPSASAPGTASGGCPVAPPGRLCGRLGGRPASRLERCPTGPHGPVTRTRPVGPRRVRPTKAAARRLPHREWRASGGLKRSERLFPRRYRREVPQISGRSTRRPAARRR